MTFGARCVLCIQKDVNTIIYNNQLESFPINLSTAPHYVGNNRSSGRLEILCTEPLSLIIVLVVCLVVCHTYFVYLFVKDKFHNSWFKNSSRLIKFIDRSIKSSYWIKYRVRQRGCSLTHSARIPSAVHQGITIWVDEIEFEKK